jgi:hypothetical protein
MNPFKNYFIVACLFLTGLQSTFVKSATFTKSAQTLEEFKWSHPVIISFGPEEAVATKELCVNIGQIVELCPQDDHIDQTKIPNVPADRDWGIGLDNNNDYFRSHCEFKGVFIRKMNPAAEDFSGDRIFKFQATEPGLIAFAFARACPCTTNCPYVHVMKYNVTIK